VHEELACPAGHDARGVLAPVLQQQQRVIDQLVDGTIATIAQSTQVNGTVQPTDG
jgi:hypothetical protein